MKSRDFCYWLQGFFEIATQGNENCGFDLTATQVFVIRNHLNMVFKHEIDPSNGDQKHNEELNKIHVKTASPTSFGLPPAEFMKPLRLPTSGEITETLLNC